MAATEDDRSSSADDGPDEVAAGARPTIGAFLNARTPRIAVLGPPGSGKSTLLKRLATAYAGPDRRVALSDGLPERDWLLPIPIRCRQLPPAQTMSIRTVIDDLPRLAEVPGIAEAFSELASDLLVEGRALLLIDGLDEISDVGARTAFVKQLRLFLTTYPSVPVVVTSREPGFRAIAPALASLCTIARVDDLTNDEVRTLCLKWHARVEGERVGSKAEAEKLVHTILSADRVRRLARNPLLLTTLLLVKRWVGELPRRRHLLYGKAIEVLLMTWNTEGHEQIEQEEAIPQLAYLAYTMSVAGAQQVSVRRLTSLVQEARAQMPELFGVSRMPVGRFINRVEDRSSVLSLVGHGYEDGLPVAFYEFKHLTFQEYLAAVAVVEGFCPREAADKDLGEALDPYTSDPAWNEIIPLAAVMAGRHAMPLITNLVRGLESSEDPDVISNRREVLVQCLADEAQVTPSVLDEAAAAYARVTVSAPRTHEVRLLVTSKYGPAFQQALLRRYRELDEHALRYGAALGCFALSPYLDEGGRLSRRGLHGLMEALDTPNDSDRVAPALAAVALARYTSEFRSAVEVADSSSELRGELRALGDLMYGHIATPDDLLCHTIMWLYADLAAGRLWSVARHPALLGRLFDRWSAAPETPIGLQAARAFREQILIDPAWWPLGLPSGQTDRFLKREYEAAGASSTRGLAALAASFYFNRPWRRTVIAEMLRELERKGPDAEVVSLKLEVQRCLTRAPQL